MARSLHPKITASALAGALVGLIVAEAQHRGFPIDAGESADLTVLISFAVGYWVPSNGYDTPPPPDAAVAVPVVVPPPAQPVQPPPPPVVPPQVAVVPPQPPAAPVAPLIVNP